MRNYLSCLLSDEGTTLYLSANLLRVCSIERRFNTLCNKFRTIRLLLYSFVKEGFVSRSFIKIILEKSSLVDV